MIKFFNIFIFISNTLFGQISVIDSLTLIPIADVHIIQNKIVKTVTNEKGQFNLEALNTNENVIFNHLGYNQFQIKHNELKKLKEILLKSNSIELEEVVLGKVKKAIEIYPDKAVKNSLVLNRPGKPWYSSQVALFIPFEKKYSKHYINKIFIHTLKGFWDKSENSKFTPFKVSLFSVDSLSNLPEYDLLNERYFIKRALNENRIEVLVSEKIDFPQNGVFVVVEILSQYSNPERPAFKRIKSKNDSKFISYTRSLLVNDPKKDIWQNENEIGIDLNYYFGLELISFE